MKPKLLARRCHVLTVDSPEQVERMLAGDFMLVQVKARTKMAATMRRLNAKRRAEGWTTRTLWFSPEQLAMLKAALLPGETYAELVMRLVIKNSLM